MHGTTSSMRSSLSEDDPPVGHLVFRSTAQPDFERTRPVNPRDEWDIGRATIEKIMGIVEPSISTHHLRLKCIMYESDSDDQVPPMVYVQILSVNAILLVRASSQAEKRQLTRGVPVRRGDSDILLCDGDILQLSPRISVTFISSNESVYKSSGLEQVHRSEIQLFKDRYAVTERLLGAGANAQVYLAFRKSDGCQLACKILSIPAFLPSRKSCSGNQDTARKNLKVMKQREALNREHEILKDLSHPNIVCLEKVFRSSRSIYILQELVTGGDLISYLDQRGALSEPDAAMVMRQLLEAVVYLHSHLIVHRDIKPENILVTSWQRGARIVLTDFGQSRRLTSVEGTVDAAGICRMQTLVGTHGYAAPEVYDQANPKTYPTRGYGMAVDIWSVGSIVPTLLTTDFLFPSNEVIVRDCISIPKILARLKTLDHGEIWKDVSHAAKSFMRGCLAVDETKRMTAKQALEHEWFTRRDYRQDFDAAYMRAIQSWRPRTPDPDPIESLPRSVAQHPSSMSEARLDPRRDQAALDLRQERPMPWDILKGAPTTNVQSSSQHARKRLKLASPHAIHAVGPDGAVKSRGQGDKSNVAQSEKTQASLRPSQLETQCTPDLISSPEL